MPIIFSQEFNPPFNLSLPQQVEYCRRIVEIQRKEGRLLRKDTASYKRRIGKLEEEVGIWQEKYGQLKDQYRGKLDELNQIKKEYDFTRPQLLDAHLALELTIISCSSCMRQD